MENSQSQEWQNRELAASEKSIAICQKIKEASGQGFLVGGWVRDQLLQKDSKDIDIEIFGLTEAQLQETLKEFKLTSEVGKTFGVYKIAEIDIALARRETKTGQGHRDFKVEVDPALTPRQTSKRRDFTVNALMYDPLEKKVWDYWGGTRDLKNRQLKMVDQATFREDPLRVYRAASLASRLSFEIEPETMAVCQQMVPELTYLPKERIGEEWKKILLSPQPSRGLKILENLGIIKRYFPELQAMIDCQQDPVYHPEGTVWVHTLLALDHASQAKLASSSRLTIMLAILLHDIAKPETAKKSPEGRVSHYEHDSQKRIAPLVRQFFHQLVFPDLDNKQIYQKVTNLAADHMTIIRLTKNLKNGQSIDKALRRLSVRLKPANLSQLIAVGEADDWATQGQKDEFDGHLLLAKAQELKIDEKQPESILTGKDLIDQGLRPGPIFGKILKAAYTAQIEGEIRNKQEALEWLKLV